VALPGIALALLYGADPFYGVIIFLTVAALLIFWLEGSSRIPPDAIVDSCSRQLGGGILIIPNADIIESLFGAFPCCRPRFCSSSCLQLAALLLCFVLSKRFLFRIVSRFSRGARCGPEVRFGAPADLRADRAWGSSWWHSLDGALTIIPAAIAKNVPEVYAVRRLSALLGGAISVGGCGWLTISGSARSIHHSVCVGLFLLSLVIGLKRAESVSPFRLSAP